MELRNEALVPSLLTPPDTRDQAETTANSHFLVAPTTSTSVRKVEHLCSAKISDNATANFGVRRGRSRTAVDCESSSASTTPANSPVKLSRKRVVELDFLPSPRRLRSEIAQSHMSSRAKRKLLSDMALMLVDSDVESNDVDTSHERSAKRRSGVTFDDRLSNERNSEIRSHNGRGASVASRRLSESKFCEYSFDEHEKRKPHTRLSAKTGSSHSVRRTAKTVSAGSDSDDDVTANVCSSKKRAKHS